jgi:hypothetical protein
VKNETEAGHTLQVTSSSVMRLVLITHEIVTAQTAATNFIRYIQANRTEWEVRAKFPKTNVNIKADKATYIRTTKKPTEPQVIVIFKPTNKCCKFRLKYSNSLCLPMSSGNLCSEKGTLEFLW